VTLGEQTTDLPRVSVVITSFNHERFIGRALDGVLEQRGVEYEIVIGDDVSTDGSRSIIERYAGAHPDRIRTFFPHENLGAGGKPLFAELVSRTRGRYIATLDGDDYWTSPDKLRIQADFLDEHSDCSMVFHNVVRRFEDRAAPDVLYNAPGRLGDRISLEEMFDFNPVPLGAAVFRREVLKPLPEWYFGPTWGDWSLYVMAAQRGKLAYLPDVMGIYRVHSGGIFSGMSRLGQVTLDLELLEQLQGIPPEAEAARRRGLAVALSRLADEHLRLGDRAMARRHLVESFRLWPLDPRRFRRGHSELRRLALYVRVGVPLRRLRTMRLAADQGDEAASRR
jgi:glycosyltransferase involved in cell wall biosynthesis